MPVLGIQTVISIIGENLLKYLNRGSYFDLCLTNKQVKNSMYGLGFLKEVEYTGEDDYTIFLKLLSIHKYTIRKTIFSKFKIKMYYLKYKRFFNLFRYTWV